MKIFSILFLFFFASTLLAQPSQPPLKILDEGVTQGTSVRELNCSGAGISCSYSNSRGTLTVGGGSGVAELSDLTDVNTSTPTNRNVLVADGVDWESRALTEADISDLTHTTDTNANTICSGSTTYLDGEGNCDNLTGVYEPAGITESDISDLDHTATGITDGLIVEADLNEDSGSPTDEDVLTYDSTGANFVWVEQNTLDAGTAAALAANGSNCSAGQYPLGVDAAGAVESCTADDDTPESGDFGAAGDLEADGSISANSVALTTDTTGNYVSGVTASQGLTMTGTEGATLGLVDCAATEILKRNAGDTAWECAADDGGSGSGDNITIDGTPIDTTADFIDADIEFDITDGGPGGPDTIDLTLSNAYEASLEVATADALAANGSNCSAGQYPLGVDAAGAVESCTADDDVPESGDFGAADDLESTGELSADVIDESKIADNAIEEEHLKAVNAAVDEDIVTYEATTGDFEYHTCAEITGSASLCDGNDADTDTNANTICAGTTTYLDGEGNCDDISSVYEAALTDSASLRATISDTSGTGNLIFAGGNIGVGSASTPAADDNDSSIATTAYVQGEINGADGTGLTCASGTCDVTLGTAIDSSEITDDTITHTDIADADQADSKCFYLEDPVAADDLKSVWRNGTANDFQVTSIWAESDQTVTFMLQLDDGSPADCDSSDLAPAAGTAEDTSLNSDCLVSAGERLDLDVASVSGTPTWVSICFTGNWVD